MPIDENSSSSYLNNIEYSRALQERYEYFQAGLNFTILAASIHTATFEGGKFQIMLELSGWLCLIMSGIIALIRFRMQPVAHKGYAQLERKKSAIERLKAGQSQGSKEVIWAESGETVPIDQAIKEGEESILANTPKLAKLESKIVRQHAWHLWLFVAGFVFVILSRAFQPLIVLTN